MKTTSKIIRIGHSPDPDDAFMFYGFASGKVQIAGHDIAHVLHDIQTLNQLAASDDPLEVTALSAHAYFGLEDRYAILPVGTSVGRSYGPRVVARKPMTIDQLLGCRVAMPGHLTTATLVARGMLPAMEEVHVPFCDVLRLVNGGEVDAGLLIHEGQLTFGSMGLHLVVDLGDLFAQQYEGLPLPLGVNCVRKDLGEPLAREVERAYRASVHVALTMTSQAVEYARAFARGLSFELTHQFVSMYVNEDSLALSEDVGRALSILRNMYRSQSAPLANQAALVNAELCQHSA